MHSHFTRATLALFTLTLIATAAPEAKIADADLAAGLARAHEIGREKPEFVTTLQSLAPAFQTVEANTTAGQAKWQRVTLNRLGKRVDAIRFRTAAADPKAKPNDLTWAFTFPDKSVEIWYICPVEGKMQGFQNFFKIKRDALKTLADAPADHKAVAQRLAANRLKPDTEYLLWFTFASDQPAEVYVAITFTPTKGATERATLEALGQ